MNPVNFNTLPTELQLMIMNINKDSEAKAHHKEKRCECLVDMKEDRLYNYNFFQSCKKPRAHPN